MLTRQASSEMTRGNYGLLTERLMARKPKKVARQKLQALGNVCDQRSPPDCDLEQYHGLVIAITRAEGYRGGINSVRMINPAVHRGKCSKGEKVEACAFKPFTGKDKSSP
jgi:hypothetical protein